MILKLNKISDDNVEEIQDLLGNIQKNLESDIEVEESLNQT
jgi:hypothetical protein